MLRGIEIDGVEMYGDSGMLCSYLNRRSQLKDRKILALTAHLLAAVQNSAYAVEIKHIDRSLNFAADRLADEATSLASLLRKYCIGNCAVQIDHSSPFRWLPVLDATKYDADMHLHLRSLIVATYENDVFVRQGNEQEVLHPHLLAALRTDWSALSFVKPPVALLYEEGHYPAAAFTAILDPEFTSLTPDTRTRAKAFMASHKQRLYDDKSSLYGGHYRGQLYSTSHHLRHGRLLSGGV